MRKRKSTLVFILAIVLAACIGSLGDMAFGQAAPTWWSWVPADWARPTYYTLLITLLVLVIWVMNVLLKPSGDIEIDQAYSKITRCDILILGLSKPTQFTLTVSDDPESSPIRLTLQGDSIDAELGNRISAALETSKDAAIPRTLENVVADLVRQIDAVSRPKSQGDGRTRGPHVNFQIQLNLLLQVLRLPRTKWPTHVIFVGSTGKDGSAHAYRSFIEGLRKLESQITFELLEVDFLDLTQIYQTLETRVTDISRDRPSKWRDTNPYVVVDSNGMGQAYATAAALFSMRRRCVLTYYRQRLDADNRLNMSRHEPTNLEMFVYDLRTIDQSSILQYFV